MLPQTLVYLHCHITNVYPTTLKMYATCGFHITAHINKKQTASFFYYALATYVLIHVPRRNMPLKLQVYSYYFMCIYEKAMSVYIYTSYVLTAVNNVTRSTGLHTFVITGICI